MLYFAHRTTEIVDNSFVVQMLIKSYDNREKIIAHRNVGSS